jgi:hypothetical protein
MKTILFFLISLSRVFTAGAQCTVCELKPDCLPLFNLLSLQTLMFNDEGQNMKMDLNTGEFIPSDLSFPQFYHQIEDCIEPSPSLNGKKGRIVVFCSASLNKDFFEVRIRLYEQFCIENELILQCIWQDKPFTEYLKNNVHYETWSSD